jgi:hypothetical protein
VRSRSAYRWPQISINIDRTGTADVRLVGILGHTIAEDQFDAHDLDEIRRSARWLGVPSTRLYDRVLNARRSDGR